MPPFSRDTIRSIYHIRAGDVFRLKKVREGGRERGRERGRRHNMKKISAFLPPLVDQSNRHCNVT